MFWLKAETPTKPSGLVQWAGLQPATPRFDSFHPHNQFFMISLFFPSRLAPNPPPPIRLCHFITSLLPVLFSGNNKCKIMTAVRVGAGVVHKQEKGGFVISDSVPAIQCRTLTLLSAQWATDIKAENERGRAREGNWKATEENRMKEDTNTEITCYRGNAWCHYSRLFISPESSWPLPAHPSFNSQLIC